ncbi:rod shape-determining protein MreC [Flavobacterium branchiophilum]|uniref:Cell shape-determining protein MreC n=1 Tax=Flavobacterium branchiophilum (strain FL-15) TaxID=1034807 RepID=G2Z408_FLABF|nr:rod shape-determining protein MreC [Flavobacterium branchiophilum]CCB68342.1 Rod shape-determining protein MreC [Flavobacterium branchiophilum FL-15]
MQQIVNFLIKNSNNLLFLLLLSTGLGFTIQSHSYHKSKIISSANFVSGNVYNELSKLNEYLSLRGQNQALAAENARLKMLLFNKKDTVVPIINPNLSGFHHTDVILAKVINNSYTRQENYLTLNVGQKIGVKTDMGVVNDQGIVGIIENTSANFATVQSILNVNSKINAKLKKSNHFGTLTWNGENTGFVQLVDIPRLASVKKGDTIVTGEQSDIFPENVNIGIVEKLYTDDETNYFTLDIKLFNDMTNLGHVYVIKKAVSLEKKSLEAKTTKNE